MILCKMMKSLRTSSPDGYEGSLRICFSHDFLEREGTVNNIKRTKINSCKIKFTKNEMDY